MSDSDTSTHSSLKSTEHKTHLVDKSVLDEIKKIKTENLASTTTDMNFQYLANEDVLVSEDKRVGFTKQLETIQESPKKVSHNYTESSDENSFYNTNKPSTPINSEPSHNPIYQAPSYQNTTNNPNNHDKDKPLEGETHEDFMLRKLNMLRKLGELTQYGVKLSQKYTMESNYNTMMYEYELHHSIRSKKNGINFLSGLLRNLVVGVEFLNEQYNPFNFKLRGWTEHISNDMDSYYDVLGELYEKYNSTGESMPPELKLMMILSGSAIQFHLQKSAMDNFPSALEQFNKTPELFEQLKQQASNDANTKNKQTMENYINAQHLEATKKANDINYLNQKNMEYNAKLQAQHAQQQYAQQQQAQYAQQQAQIAQLAQQAQLGQQIAQNNIMHQNDIAKQQKLLEIAQLQQKLNQTKYDSEMAIRNQGNIINQPTIKKPTIPIGMQQIKPAPQVTDYASLNSSRKTNDTRSLGTINPQLDELLNINEPSIGSSFDTHSKDSKVSIRKKKPRKKKPTISIETSSL